MNAGKNSSPPLNFLYGLTTSQISSVLCEGGDYCNFEDGYDLTDAKSSTRHWYSTNQRERAQTVRSERSRASGKVEERDFSRLLAFDFAARSLSCLRQCRRHR